MNMVLTTFTRMAAGPELDMHGLAKPADGIEAQLYVTIAFHRVAEEELLIVS